MKLGKNIILLLVILAGFTSCKLFSVFSFSNQGNRLIAKLDKHNLYAEDIASTIPKGLGQKDSLLLVNQYIKKWAIDNLLSDLAQKELSDKEKDLSREIEAYKTALLGHRYEQAYINQRLDTVVNQGQIEDYYQNHKDEFNLDRPILKLRFVRIAISSPYYEKIVDYLSSDNDEKLSILDSLTKKTALKYSTYSDQWVDAEQVAKDFGLDYKTMLEAKKKNYIKLREANTGIMNIAYILEQINPGMQAPVEYYSEQIKDIIISKRKQNLINNLERALLIKAEKTKKFVVLNGKK